MKINFNSNWRKLTYMSADGVRAVKFVEATDLHPYDEAQAKSDLRAKNYKFIYLSKALFNCLHEKI